MQFSALLPDAPNVAALDQLVDDPEQAQILTYMGDRGIALKVMRSGLWFSYMFNRYTIPTYASHVFRALTRLSAVDDELGTILAGVMGAVKGELFNNNIYGGKECHSHYLDMQRAYLAAGGDPEVVSGIPTQRYSHTRSCIYADHLLTLLEDPLSTFILIPAIEKNTPHFFETVSKHLCREPQFDAYRQFVDRHIELDRGDHSCVTMDWLKYYLEHTATTIEQETTAIAAVINIIELGRGRR